ncbi:MAG TPA: cytochrome c3 family protein [Acidobacteriota bacterium]|nr:cytochrome c3 family protein [Acidobacteriota bacterium]
MTIRPAFIFGLLGALLVLFPAAVTAQEVDDCMACHEDFDLTTERDGVEVSLGIDLTVFGGSVHGEFDCITCHADLEGADFPHDTPLDPVDCGMCHDDVAAVYRGSLHGRLVETGEPLAPRCWDCHGSHGILPAESDSSQVTKFNIPFMCGRCHKEGTPVTQTYDIPKDSILAHYSLSIHGYGLYQQGLIVTAVCSDCHTAHNVLPHTDPRSSIFRDNVPRTCEQCHRRIEDVHKKRIRGELWATEPDRIPICIDCHEPHKARRILYEEGVSDQQCMSCHRDPDLFTIRDNDTISLYVDSVEVHNSIHRRNGVTCAQCHTGALPSPTDRPCRTMVARVDCSTCHAEVVATYETGTHGILAARGDPNAPQCADCHGTHGTRGHVDRLSPTYPSEVPALCARCHREGEAATVRYRGEQHDIVSSYIMSIHGKGLLESGLVVTAMCTDCHTAHHTLPSDNPASSVYPDNIPQTCGKCHNGIYEKFEQSVHSPTVTETDKPLPKCHDCHSSHTIERTGQEGFKLTIMEQCGRCHEDVSESYFETIHGKVSKLGYTVAAKCYDCHGAHDILPIYDPRSHLSRGNIVETCRQCHPGSHRQFAGYLTHATHHDRNKYPILFYTFWFMTILLIGTLSVFGLHTIMWLPRSFQAMRANRKIRHHPHKLVFRRFNRRQRQLHALVVISFLGLALTGMTLKFSYLGWAVFLSRLLGGFESASFIHRVCAVITFYYFGTHLVMLAGQKRRSRKTWRRYLLDKDSMIPNRNDWQDLKATLRWFVGLGPRPGYGRWTYWEKFDYFAVFWGVIIIGSTGLMLWFPEFFTRFLPGWFINVATIVHSDEALLAVGFIFTIHFFNTHFRPDKFPMDTVIFTGRVPLAEFRSDRPREFTELVQSRELKKHLTEPLPPLVTRGMKLFGWVALSIGLTLVILIIWAEVFGYR